MKYTYCALTPQMWKAKIADIGECGKIDMEKEESSEWRVAQFALYVNYLFHSILFSPARSNPSPSGEGVASVSEQRPGGYFLAEE